MRYQTYAQIRIRVQISENSPGRSFENDSQVGALVFEPARPEVSVCR
jgi:hypothetical protein